MDRLIYERKLKPGNGPQSYGILVCKSMKLDNEFVKMAELIRNQIEAGEVLKFNNRLSSYNINIESKKVSKYNNDKLFHNCEICGLKGEDIHHINMQCSSDNKGIIESDNGKFHKNEKWNLVCLCKSCHNNVHKSEPKLKINGYKETSDGYKLEFVYLDTNIKTDYINGDNIILDNDNVNGDNIILDTDKNNITNNINDNAKEDDDDNLRLNDILRLFNDGKSIRSIQYFIRDKYGYKLKLKEIETIISNT
jgi:DNA mismatch repair protein MutS